MPKHKEKFSDERSKALKQSTLDKLFRRKVIGELGVVVKSGKEAEIIEAKTESHQKVLIKLFFTIANANRHRNAAFRKDSRYRAKVKTGSLKSVATAWAEKEARNLLRTSKVTGLNCAECLEVVDNAVVLSRIEDETGRLAPTLKETVAQTTDLSYVRELYLQILQQLHLLLSAGKLLHGDLSAENILVADGKVFLIDFAQSSPFSDNSFATLDREDKLLLEKDFTLLSLFFAKRIAVFSLHFLCSEFLFGTCSLVWLREKLCTETLVDSETLLAEKGVFSNTLQSLKEIETETDFWKVDDNKLCRHLIR